MNDPEIVVNENEDIIEINDTARSLIGDKKVNDLGDIFEGIVSLKLFGKDNMKVPFKTKEGKRISEIMVDDLGEQKKIVVPLDKNKWVAELLTDMKLEEPDFDEKREAIEQIEEIEEELKKSTNLDARRTLIFGFESTKEVNIFSDEIRGKNNVEIENTEQRGDQILVVVRITSPTREWI
ncbi:hypothetical protein C9439_07235 [archaeon SCG-AAA382B04]|nr:hypothetical protein C9439_07235 [archaeon SCG-AAA382B04]